MTRKVNIAVIGTGRMGSIHVNNLARKITEANLVALCDLRVEVAQKLADELGITRVEKDYHDLLEDPTIEAYLIATNTPTHADIICDVAAKRKHIFCEKPLALDLESIDKALAVVSESKIKLQVGFNRRFDKSFQEVRRIVHSGEIGRSCLLHIVNYDPELPAIEFLRTSGGLFLDQTIHDFDMARFQIGEVEEIYATGSVLIDPELNTFGDLDTAVLSLKFQDGTMGTIDNSRQAAYGYDQRLEVLCLHGSAMARNEEEHTTVIGNDLGFHSARIPHFFPQRFASCYIEEVRQFIECVRDDKPTPINGEDGRKAVVLGHAAWKSFQEHRPVKISEIR
jgi:myo-inositol 2-dehydrogenase/D-chiro-inositol 1-dehydrogenase